MTRMVSEFFVYSKLLDFLKSRGWTIICASPPGGTNGRYRKCLFPRRDLSGNEKGPRDEADLMAHNDKIVMITECKPKLSESLNLPNNLQESDYTKLKRIANSFTPAHLSSLLRQAYGKPVPLDPLIALALAVGEIDCAAPSDVSIFEFGHHGQTIKETGFLVGQF